MKTKQLLLSLIAFFAISCANAQTWTNLNSGSASDLKADHFPTTNVGYAVGTFDT